MSARTVLLAALVAGCGSSPRPQVVEGSCPADLGKFQPCGGDLSGRWLLTAACRKEQTPIDGHRECSGASWTVQRSIRGTIEFSGGTETDDYVETVTTDAFMPEACLNASFLGDTGPSLCFSLAPSTASGQITYFTGGTCSFTNGVCTCHATLESPVSFSRSYQTEGDVLHNTFWDMPPPHYCSSGAWLNIDYGSGAYGQYYVLKKQ